MARNSLRVIVEVVFMAEFGAGVKGVLTAFY